MSTLRCQPDEAWSAYYCVMLFDSIGYELYPQDLQETNGVMGQGIYCTLDFEKAQSTGKEVLISEFRPTCNEPSRSGASEILVVAEGREEEGKRWRSRGFSGVLFQGTELCLRGECVTALYRREWRRPEAAWQGLARAVKQLLDPPLAVDSETSQTEASWAKAMERLKTYGDKQVRESRERLENAWTRHAEQSAAGSACVVS